MALATLGYVCIRASCTYISLGRGLIDFSIFFVFCSFSFFYGQDYGRERDEVCNLDVAGCFLPFFSPLSIVAWCPHSHVLALARKRVRVSLNQILALGLVVPATLISI